MWAAVKSLEVLTSTQSCVWPCSSRSRFTTAVKGTGHWLQLSRLRPRHSRVCGPRWAVGLAAGEAAAAVRAAKVRWRWASRFSTAAGRGEADGADGGVVSDT